MVMRAKTLSLSKLTIAVSHIHAAIELKSRFGHEASILHLAAAADEIIEAFLKRKGKPTMSQALLAQFQKYAPNFDRKTFHQAASRTKNAVKHADHPDGDIVEISELQDFTSLIRAILNYELLTGTTTPQMQEFMGRYKKI